MTKKFATSEEANSAIAVKLEAALKLIREAEELAKRNKVSFDLTIGHFVKGTYHGDITNREYIDERWEYDDTPT
jgi:hypothetical protein